MASPVENLHTFDLHIHVGTRSWPDDVELYCEVTFPGLDAAHPIVRNYMRMEGGLEWSNSLEHAIRIATDEIKSYMTDPEAWVEAFSEPGPAMEKHRLELEIEERTLALEQQQASLARQQEHLEIFKQRLQALGDEKRGDS